MDVATLLILVLPLVAIWFLVMRPAQRRQKAMLEMRSSLAPGVEIMTTAGLYGTVRRVADDVIDLEVADGVVLRFAKAAVGTVVPPEPPAAGPDDAPEA